MAVHVRLLPGLTLVLGDGDTEGQRVLTAARAALPCRPPAQALGVLAIRRFDVALTRMSGLRDAERLIP